MGVGLPQTADEAGHDSPLPAVEQTLLSKGYLIRTGHLFCKSTETAKLGGFEAIFYQTLRLQQKGNRIINRQKATMCLISLARRISLPLPPKKTIWLRLPVFHWAVFHGCDIPLFTVRGLVSWNSKFRVLEPQLRITGTFREWIQHSPLALCCGSRLSSI